MQVVEQFAMLLSMTTHPCEVIELAGRTCYKSEDKIDTGSAIKFVKMLLKREHESVLEHASASFRLVTDRGVSHEIVRHRLASYSQESTRYCSYETGISVIKPVGLHEVNKDLWYLSCCQAESIYKRLLENGVSPQEARAVLPTCLKTEIVMTANFREWRLVFKLRRSPAAHPQMRALMNLVFAEMLQTPAAPCFEDLG